MPTFFQKHRFKIVLAGFASLVLWWGSSYNMLSDWTEDEIKTLQSLSINKLSALPADPSNTVADNLQAAEFGRHLFFDERFSHNSKLSCATCHIPDLFFTDGLVRAAGAQAGLRNTPTVVGTAYSPWQFWDGRSDSQWAQALSPLENDLEHAASRNQIAHIIFDDIHYRKYYENIFGSLPDLSNKQRFPLKASPSNNRALNNNWETMSSQDQKAITTVFVNIAKSLAAYQRLLQPAASRFDYYIDEIIKNDENMTLSLNKNEIRGLKLFIGKAECINCHNGPLLTNNEFHNTGIPTAERQEPSVGRSEGAHLVMSDPFNCQGKFSDSNSAQCENLRFIKTGDELLGAHKVPTLRNIAQTAPYMHAGQLSSLDEVIEHYIQAPNAELGHTEIKALKLSKKEKNQLTQFLHSLTGPLKTDPKWLVNPHI